MPAGTALPGGSAAAATGPARPPGAVLDRLALAVAAALYAWQIAIVSARTVNVPYWDDWVFLVPGRLDSTLNVDWLFEWHNQHRMVVTKLQMWLMMHLTSLDMLSQVLVNYALFLLIVVVLLRFLESRFQMHLGFLAILFASTIPGSSHIWAFGSLTRPCLLFFLLGVVCLQLSSRASWAGVAFLVVSAYSMAAGVIGAACSVALCLALASLVPERKRRYRLQALVLGLLIVPWFYGFPIGRDPIPTRPPWTLEFGSFFFNIVSAGFGYNRLDALPGIAILLVLLTLLAWRLRTLGRIPRSEQCAVAAVATVALAMLATTALTAGARAPMGPDYSKSSRYAELVLPLIPVLWVLAQSALRGAPPRTTRLVSAALAVALFVPFADNFQWAQRYESFFSRMRAAERCVQDYLAGAGSDVCPAAYWERIGPRIEHARSLGLGFASRKPARGQVEP